MGGKRKVLFEVRKKERAKILRKSSLILMEKSIDAVQWLCCGKSNRSLMYMHRKLSLILMGGALANDGGSVVVKQLSVNFSSLGAMMLWRMRPTPAR